MDVDIEWNELTYCLANEDRTVDLVPLSTTVFDANAVAKQNVCINSRRKFSLPELNCNLEIKTTIGRLRSKHFIVYIQIRLRTLPKQ